MDTKARIALHEKLAQGFFKAYAEGSGRKRIQFPEEFVIRRDAHLVAPMIDDPFPIGEHIAASGLSVSDLQTMEWGLFWRVLPDFRAVDPHRIIANEDGFALWWSMTGTAIDGRVVIMHEADFMVTDKQGRITQWEVFLDTKEFGNLLDVCECGVDAADMSWEAYTGLTAQFAAHSAPYISAETHANWKAAGLIPAVTA